VYISDATSALQIRKTPKKGVLGQNGRGQNGTDRIIN